MRISAFLLALLLAGPSRAAEGPAAEFFVMLRAPDGTKDIHLGNRVPLIPGRACYGWRARVTGGAGQVAFREILSLPGDPPIRNGEDDQHGTTEKAKDRKKTVTERFVRPRDGWISNFWCVAKGDPEGTYAMEVFIAEQFVKRFDFDVRKPAETSQ